MYACWVHDNFLPVFFRRGGCCVPHTTAVQCSKSCHRHLQRNCLELWLSPFRGNKIIHRTILEPPCNFFDMASYGGVFRTVRKYPGGNLPGGKAQKTVASTHTHLAF